MALHHKSPLAGKTVKLKKSGVDYRVEDWWDLVGGQSWMHMAMSNMACMQYAMRALEAGLPQDNEVLYGKIGAFGRLIHISEIAEEQEVTKENK